MYGQPQLPQQQQPTPGAFPVPSASPNPSNPYSKPGQIRGSYPRATGAYPQLPQPGQGQQRPVYPPQ